MLAKRAVKRLRRARREPFGGSLRPDGTRVAFGKWLNDPSGNPGVRPVTVVDVASGEEHEVGLINAPAAGEDAAQIIVIDAETGEITRPGWTTGSALTWQRVAP